MPIEGKGAPMPKEKVKKEPTPKVRKVDYVLFVEDNTFCCNEIARYPDLRSLLKGVKEKVEALPEGAGIPEWSWSTCRFKKVGITRIKDVKVKL